MRRITGDLTVAQANPPARPLHDLRIVGGKDECRTVITIELFHHIEERQSGGRIKIRRRLVGQDQHRFGDHSPSHSNPLLLPAGQLCWTTIFKAGETDFQK